MSSSESETEVDYEGIPVLGVGERKSIKLTTYVEPHCFIEQLVKIFRSGDTKGNCKEVWWLFECWRCCLSLPGHEILSIQCWQYLKLTSSLIDHIIFNWKTYHKPIYMLTQCHNPKWCDTGLKSKYTITLKHIDNKTLENVHHMFLHFLQTVLVLRSFLLSHM